MQNTQKHNYSNVFAVIACIIAMWAIIEYARTHNLEKNFLLKMKDKDYANLHKFPN